jgi:hypothetical protein
VLDSKRLTVSQIRSHLSYNLTHVASDVYSDGGEEGLFALKSALTGAKLDAIKAQGFVRDEAALAVVFVSDEQDICYDYPAGVAGVRDPDGYETSSKARDCAGVTPESVQAAVKTAKGVAPYLIGGVLYNNEATYVRQGENELGYGYLDLIRLVSGISVDMAGSSYTEGLAQLGSLARVKLELLSDFTLARPEIDPESIRVYVDGIVTDFSYTATTNEVHVSDPGIARSVVELSYCKKPQGCTGPTCGGGVIGI